MIDVEDIVKEIVANQFEYLKNRININYIFTQDYCADSLDIMELFMAFENKFDVYFTDKNIEELTTSSKVISFIKKKLKKKYKKNNKNCVKKT
ncbi:acyl carrier protein [Candidatus Zinderia endosymbiont of Aphrophora alni]|uniref:acyl carrier protein n=1 Tax=Candidatus Zinderia endosymbiont of Aphrophora alni TaxID=3077951 RepID=UPI0030CCEA84